MSSEQGQRDRDRGRERQRQVSSLNNLADAPELCCTAFPTWLLRLKLASLSPSVGSSLRRRLCAKRQAGRAGVTGTGKTAEQSQPPHTIRGFGCPKGAPIHRQHQHSPSSVQHPPYHSNHPPLTSSRTATSTICTSINTGTTSTTNTTRTWTQVSLRRPKSCRL